MGLAVLWKWNLPGPGIEPMSPAGTGGFLSTVAPGKSKTTKSCFLNSFLAVKDLSRPAEVCWKVPPSGTSYDVPLRPKENLEEF